MKNNTKEWGIAALFVVLAYLLLIQIFDRMIMPQYTRHGRIVEVPDVVELNREEAEAVLKERGFTLVMEKEQNDAHYPEGTIISQNPAALTKTKPERRVYVTVSIGSKLAIMPNLVGKAAQDAEFAIQSEGLSLSDKNVSYEFSNYYPEGIVIAQSAPPGTKLKKDTRVRITVSLGNMPEEFRIPNCVGQTLERARKMILKAGMTLGEIREEVQDNLLPNTVIAQSPDADQISERGQKVDLIISKLEEN